jgi:purine nucleoside permease
VRAILNSAYDNEIYPFYQNLYFKKSETIDVTPNNTHVHCNTQSVLLMTSTETETHQGKVQAADDMKAEIFQYMTQ